MSRCLNLPNLRRATMARAALASPSTTPSMCVPSSLYIDMSSIVSADALTKPYNSASAELRATSACVFAPHFDEMRPCNCVSSYCAAACSSATCPFCVWERFKLARCFLKLIRQLNRGSVFRMAPQSHHLLPISCCWRCHVTCQLFCTVHDVSSVNGKKIGSCCQCSIPSGFGRAQNLSDQWLFHHAQLSQFSLLHNVVCFVSHFLLAFFGRGDLQRRQIGCSCFADDCFCVFPVCFIGYPDSIAPTERSIQYLHLLRHSWFVPKYCGVDFQLRLQLVSHPNQIHWFS